MDLKKGAEYKGEFREQMSQLQNLVDQMKEGFIQAMEELSRVQDGDRLLQQEVKDHKQETDKKVEELTTCVHQIRADLSSVLKEVQKSNKETGRLAEQFESLRREHGRMRRKLKQNERNIENQRQKEQRPSISQSTKSEGDANKSDTNHTTAPNDNLLRRRKSTPAAYSNLKGARECRSVLPLEAQTPMAPMMQPFIDSLPDPGDLNNNDGNTSFDLLEGDDSRQYTTQRSGGSSNSSGNDTKEREQMSKAFSPGRRVSFSTVDQTHSSSDDPEGQRIQVAEEFLSSERKYVGQLNALLDNIMLPLVTESLIHPSDINVIFPPSLAKMFDRHCCLLCALETRLSDALWQGMHGDIFAKFAGPESSSFLSQYGSYISSFPESLSLLSHHTRKSGKLTNFLKKQLADIEDEQADLLGYLLAPIQRIPAYVLHLKTVLEVTDSDHPDHFHMESCLTHLGSFLATMNPAIEQAVEAARTHILFLSETKGSLASTFSPHVSMSSQSSSLTKDSGVQSMENVSPYNRLTHHRSSEKDVPRAVHDSVTGGQWHSSPIRQQKAPSHSYTLPNGYRRDRRASFPGFSLIENQRAGAREAMAQSSPRTPQKHRAHTARRGSYDQRMLTETNQGMSRDIPGMMYIPEQASDEAESLYRSRDLNKHRRNSRLQNDLPELPRYGIYGEDDNSEEIGYEPSSPSSALPRATQTGVIQHQQSPRHRRQFDTPLSSSTSSRTSTPRDYVYHTEAAGSDIMFEETDIHQYQQLRNRQRSASGSNKVLRVRDLSSEPRGGSTLQLQHSSSSSEHRKRSHSIPHLSRVRMPESAKPGILKDVWNERKQVNGSAEKMSTPRTTKKNNLKKSPRAGATPVSKSAKKSNFLTGPLRNIFFGKSSGHSRKRGSQVVELDGAPSQSTVNSSADEFATSSRLEADTYHDEDGQPCSDV